MAHEYQSSAVGLPAPGADQAYMEVSALEGGIIKLPLNRFIMGASEGDYITCPSLAFSLRHSKSNVHLLFDLGLRKDISSYSPSVQKMIKEIMPVIVVQDVTDSLKKGGVQPADVETVILSHLHFDHIGDSTPFTKAIFVVGEESQGLLANGYPDNPESVILSASIPKERTRFLFKKDFSTSIATFPHAYDYFGDGSLYVIDAPGHIGGHVNLLARTSSTGTWIYLAGDTCHDVRLLTGEKQVYYEADEAGKVTLCFHADKDKAEEHIRRVGELRKFPGVHVLLAHDWEWFEKNKDGSAFLPGKIPKVSL